MTILITAASGNLGSEITKKLCANNGAVVGGVRSPMNVKKVADVEYVAFDYDDPSTYKAFLEKGDVDGVVLQAPPLDFDAFERLSPFINELKASNINRVVFISAYGVDHNDAAPLRRIELKLIEDGFDYTFVRPNFFMENFTSGFAVDVLEHKGIVLASSGDGKIAFVSIQDIAAVVLASLSEGGHVKKEYNLTGPEALSHGEIAQIISEKRGKDIPYISISGDELKAGAVENGLPESCADYLAMLYSIAEQGLMAELSNDVEIVLKRKPLAFGDIFTS